MSRTLSIKASVGALLFAFALAGCSGDRHKNTRHARERAAKELATHLEKGPTKRRYAVDGSELLVLDVPVASMGLPEVQRCFVWRDGENRTSTISCARLPEMAFDDSTAQPE